MYGDPRGYKYDGPPQLVSVHRPAAHGSPDGNLSLVHGPPGPGAAARGRRRSRCRPGTRDGYSEPDRSAAWLGYLEGKTAGLSGEGAAEPTSRACDSKMEMIRTDQTTADSRLADYLLDFNPATTNGLRQPHLGRVLLARPDLGAAQPLPLLRSGEAARRSAGGRRRAGGEAGRGLGHRHAGQREPDRCPRSGGAGRRIRRAPLRSRHRGRARRSQFSGPALTVGSSPARAPRLEFKMTRYANRPTFAFPWDRGWYPGTK